MNNFKYLSIILLQLIYGYGCSTTNQEIKIKDLDAHSIKFEVAKPIVPNRQDAIKNYKSYIDNTGTNQNHATALKRLADLELESTETNSEKEDAQTKKIMLSSIEHYNTYLKAYPDQAQNDLILYQLAKAYSFNGDFELALQKMNIIVKQYPDTKHINEVQFRRGEILFVMGDFKNAEIAYESIVKQSDESVFHEKALYKLGWAQFKQSKYLKSLANYLHLLDRKQAEGKLTPEGINKNLNRSEADFINDTLRVISLALSYKNGTGTIQLLFSGQTNRNYEALIFKNLGDLYLSKDRHTDASNVFLAYGVKHPENPQAAEFHDLAIKALAAGNFHDFVLSAKESFVRKYGVNTVFWTKQDQQNRLKIKQHLILHIRELANHYHALARKSHKAQDYNKAAVWYNVYLSSFPDDQQAPHINFLLAESLFDANEFNSALTEYSRTAYNYSIHTKSSEAGYASILTFNKLMDISSPENKNIIKSQAIKNSIRFCNTFPEDKHAPQVVTKTAEDLYEIKNYTLAAEFSKRIIDNIHIKDDKLLKTSWTVYAHSLFELDDYAGAELAYIEVLKRTNKKIKLYADISEKLAACIYKQGELQRDGGHLELAAFHFMRLGKVIPTSTIRATAEYDAATMHIKLEQWDKATSVLENFNRRFPGHKTYSRGITEKLALTYTNSGKFSKAAAQIVLLASLAVTVKDKQELTWQAAEMYSKSGQNKKANDLYIQYIKKYPQPFPQYIEAHKLVSDYYLNSKQYKNWGTWLKKTVSVEARGGKQRTDRTNLIAAQAIMHIARPMVKRFEKVRLDIPLKKSLKKKKSLMQQALKTYADVIKYQIAEITTESTYYVAEIYHHFSKALLNSQRPKGLSGEELEQYDILLEEQAYPFEEKTIDIHSKNTSRTKDGIYDNWVKRSFAALEKIQPVRYSKTEKIDSYIAVNNE